FLKIFPDFDDDVSNNSNTIGDDDNNFPTLHDHVKNDRNESSSSLEMDNYTIISITNEIIEY
ncbi:hypothetical protein KI387_037227, partial [Taxus chinensis]